MNERRCQRGYMCNRVIPAGEIYRIAGAAYTTHCKECAADVFGPRWAVEPYAQIGKDGHQVEWHIRKEWAATVDAYQAAVEAAKAA